MKNIIETKYSINQKVFYLSDNKVTIGYISRIEIIQENSNIIVRYIVVDDDKLLYSKSVHCFRTTLEEEKKNKNCQFFESKKELLKSL